MRGAGWRAAGVFGIGLAWLAGVGLQLHERQLSAVVVYERWVWMSLASAAAVVVVWPWARWRWMLLACAFALGFGTTGWRAAVRLAEHLPAVLEGQDLELVGVVAGLPQRSPNGLRFRFELESASQQGRPVELPQQLILGWYAGWRDEGGPGAFEPGLRAGQRWRLTARLRQPHGNLNPHGFDYELLVFEQGVRATGSVRDRPAPLLLDAQAGHPVDRWRQDLRDAIERTVDDPRTAGVLAALAVGDQSAISREDWQLFRDTGVAHLMSISGLHVTMFAWLAGLAVAAAWRRHGGALHRVPAPLAGRWGGLVAATAYAVFAGWGVPAQRTVWMLATVAVLQLGARRWPWSAVLLAAAVVVASLDPWALLQPGFWLSFVAVGLLMASAPAGTEPAAAPATWWRKGLVHARAGLRTQVVATLGLTPLSLVFFQQVSVLGFVANLVAIPLVTLVVTPLALLGVMLPVLWRVGAAVQGLLSRGLALLGEVPGAVWPVAVAPVWAQAAGLAGAVWLVVLPLPWRWRLLAGPLLLPLLCPVPTRPAHGQFELTAVDVGQGTAVLVRTRQHLMVYDAGPQYARDGDAGQRVLLPLLRARGETRIDRLVVSHRDADHVGGAAALLRGLPAGDLLSSLEDAHPVRMLAPHAVRCEAGQAWTWDGVRFEVLHPRAEDYGRGHKPNAMSCVLKVGGAGASVLLTGDIERAQEAELLARDAGRLRADVLLVPHHGSRTSSTAAFLDAVGARLAVVQAGYHNRFGHPVPEVLARLHERGMQVIDSPGCGAWHWAPDPEDGRMAGACEREIARRYWHHTGAGR
jgi:competence protein ComEC